ncbi:acyl-CoA dehydrogenase family protein [Streptomyces aidingensis]|uniref:Acyl-CoA dehydrogenase n=1 Tax=Streptomyces aidingensis TaxID=910347 RepID=A0A1I1SJ09_9ACTN|nr:acyl-CoA dehydrogenase family protein [Streptomyces aidingensis]SFD46469.1 Acyl-CoA dehydrogenase [Streptomyces aidingensis]
MSQSPSPAFPQDPPPEALSAPTDRFLAGIAELARTRFDCQTYPLQQLPADDWARLVRAGVLLPALPKEFGGRDSHAEMCRVVEILAEWNLPIAMYTKIITAVALRPIALRADERARREVLPQFAGQSPMICGFAATEPGCGSGMSAMTTVFTETADGYHLRGRKHWQGFSGTAHWWLVAARSADDGPRRYGYFILRRDEGFRTVRRYDALGMKALDYGLNEIDAVIPRHRRIDAEEGNLSAMVEMLMPPRAMMSALAAGFLRRISREAHAYAERRRIGPAPQSAIRFVRYRLKSIETSALICEALSHHLRTEMDLKADMTEFFPAALAMKTVATERMVGSAHHYQQLVGGEGYRTGSGTNIAGQAFLDTRVFTIFDGTNDLLSQQLAEYCLARCDGRPLSGYLAAHPDFAAAVAAHRLDLRFLDGTLRQEHLVLAGRAIAYLFAIARVMRWAAEEPAGSRPGRARPAIAFLKSDIDGVRREFELLAAGVLDDPPDGGPAGPEADTGEAVPLLSRSIPRPAVPAH